MKTLDTHETIQLWIHARKLSMLSPEKEKDLPEIDKITQAMFTLCSADPELVVQWQKGENTRKVNQFLKEVNRYANQLLDAESQIAQAGDLLVNDLEKAEACAQKAVALVVNGKSSEAEKTLENKKEKAIVNAMANRLMILRPTFCAQRVTFIKNELEKTYGSSYIQRDGQIQFRVVRPCDDYGRPETVFQEGFAPQFVSVWDFQKGILNKPYVHDAAEYSGEKVGWTGGVVSTSANLKFVSAFDFAALYGQQEGWIYAVSIHEAASVGEHITLGTGYDGLVEIDEIRNKGGSIVVNEINRSNAEAAMEYMVGFVPPNRVVAARHIDKNGKLGEIKFNASAATSSFGDMEYIKFITCDSVDELKLIEFLEYRSSEIQAYGNNPDDSREKMRAKAYVSRMKIIFDSLSQERQALLLALADAEVRALNSVMPAEKYQQLLHRAKHLRKIYPNSLATSYKKLFSQEKSESSYTDVRSHFLFDFERNKRAYKERKKETAHPTEHPIRPQTRYKRRRED